MYIFFINKNRGKKYLFDHQILKQNHAARIIFYADRQTDARPFRSEIKTLDVYQVNIQQAFPFMQRVKISSIPRIFKYNFHSINHSYLLRFSKNTFKQAYAAATNYEKFPIASRDPQLWNKCLPEMKKTMTNTSFFKNTAKNYLPKSINNPPSY